MNYSMFYEAKGGYLFAVLFKNLTAIVACACSSSDREAGTGGQA